MPTAPTAPTAPYVRRDRELTATAPGRPPVVVTLPHPGAFPSAGSLHGAAFAACADAGLDIGDPALARLIHQYAAEAAHGALARG